MVLQTAPENAPPEMVREYFDFTSISNSLQSGHENDPHEIFHCPIVGDPGENLSSPMKREILKSLAISTASLHSEREKRPIEKALRFVEKEKEIDSKLSKMQFTFGTIKEDITNIIVGAPQGFMASFM